jgi:pimeloyl-ACP methyl ester carboxylesterase
MRRSSRTGSIPAREHAGRRLHERSIPQARLVVFDESGHVPMAEGTEKLNRALDEFAKEVA